jgi:peroxiredoxin Q/BCP
MSNLQTRLQVGDKAPSFNVDGFRLEDFLGKIIVLYFYPKDDTPGCTIEAKEFAENQKTFDLLEAKVLGVSKDSRACHEKFQSKHELTFDLISDDAGLCELYGVWGEKSMFGKKYMGITRATFLIDRSGQIVYIWPNVTVNDHALEVIAKIKELNL